MLVSLTMALALVPTVAVTALAEEAQDASDAALRLLSSSDVTATGTCGTVTWTLYGDGELVLAPTSGDTGTLEGFSGAEDVPWYDYRENIVSVTVDGTVVCGSSVAYMFFNCSSLTTLDLSGLDTSSVTSMFGMFHLCRSLESLDLSSFDTSSVTDMTHMFCQCLSLESLDLSSFDTSSVTSMAHMFNCCTSLNAVYISELWSTDLVTSDSSVAMFGSCTSLVGGNGTTYSSDHVDYEYARIDADDGPGYFTYKAYEDSDDIGSNSLIDAIIDWVLGNTLPIDVWSFSNSSKYFTSGYQMLTQDYEKYLSNLEYIEAQSALDHMDDDWDGSCYGMSSWVVLTELGTRNASDIDASTVELFDYESIEIVQSAINFYQLQQYLQPAEIAAEEFLALDTEAQVDELASLVKAGGPVLLGFQYYKYDEDTADLAYEVNDDTGEEERIKIGHAIVAYDLEDGDYTDYVNGLLGNQAVDGVAFTHRVVTYDCSQPNGGEAYYLYYADDGTWCIPGRHAVCQANTAQTDPNAQDNAYMQQAYSSIDILNSLDYETGECSYSVDHDWSISSLCSRSYSYDASWASGSASISGFTVTDSTGDGDVSVAVDENVTADGESSSSADTTAFLPVSGSYTVTSGDHEVSLSLKGGDYLTSVGADASGTATLYADGGAAVSAGSATSITVSVTANDDASLLSWATVEVSADDATELTVDLTEDGLVIADTDVDEVTVTTYDEVGDDGEETVVETGGGTVLVTEDEGALESEEDYDYEPATDEEREANRIATAATEAISFPDVQDSSKWYYDSIYEVAELGLLTGYDNGYFGVGDTMTRAQLAVVMWRIDQPDAAAAYDGTATNVTGMSDVKDDKYYTAAVNWAVDNGVFNGKEASDGSRYFDPSGAVTFQEFCAVMANYLGSEERDALSLSLMTLTLFTFVDGDEVSDWAKASVTWCVDAGLVSGNKLSDGSLSIAPKTKVKRERAATVLANAVEEGVLVV